MGTACRTELRLVLEQQRLRDGEEEDGKERLAKLSSLEIEGGILTRMGWIVDRPGGVEETFLFQVLPQRITPTSDGISLMR